MTPTTTTPAAAGERTATMPTDPRLLTPGTETPLGVTDRQTLTGWFMTDGSFVPFIKLARPAPAIPLVGGITVAMVEAALAMRPLMPERPLPGCRL
jgi:hypothetical protein